ncbi:MAG TPA: hypothetical protein VEL11_02050 [Candidatus Bathyarchaeia archaeon]|nr:hypothetical protein [Candidatus Bathyarchaeia archaeon]
MTSVEVPIDESMMSIMLPAGRLGNVRSERMKAIPMHEAGKIIEYTMLVK